MAELNFGDLVKDYQASGNMDAGKKARPVKPSDMPSKAVNNEQENKPGSKNWYKRQSEWIWWMYANNYTDFNWSGRAEMLINRLYAQGRQPTEKYMPQMGCKWDGQANRWKTWLNISFDIFAVLPSIRAKVLGSFDKVDYNISAHSVDEFAGAEREEQIYKQVEMMEDKDFYDTADMLLGTENEKKDELPFIPQNQEQIDLLKDLGFLKLKSEIEIEKLLSQSSIDSRWKEVIKRKLFEDAFDLGRIAVKDYVDPVSKRVMCRYADPANMIARYAMRDEFYEDVSYVGEVRPYTVGDLVAYGIKGEELAIAIKYYGNKCGNIYNNINDTYLNPKYYDMSIYVMDLEFESFDFQKWEYVDDKQTEVEFTQDTQNPTQTTRYPRWHRCKWVIGTDIIFDYGYQYDVPYTQDERPQSSYSIVRIADRSPVSLAVADADEVQLLVLKWRAALAKARPPGTVFDANTIQEIQEGGRKMSILDQIDAFNQTGDMLIRSQTTPTGQAIPGIAPPFYERNDGYGQYMLSLRQIINESVMSISQKIGISSPIDGAPIDPNMPVRTTEIALEGTNNALRNLLIAYQSVKKQTFNKMAYRYEIMDKANLLGQYTGIIGGENLNLLKFINTRFHGISVDALVDDDLKNDILNKASLSLQAAKTGGIGIEFSDYFAIRRMLENGLLKQAEFFLAWREDLRRKQAEQLQQQNMALNKDMAISTEEEKRKTAMQLQDMQVKSQASLDNNKIMSDMMAQMKLGQEQLSADIKKILIQGKIDEHLEQVRGEVDKDIAVIEGEVDVKVAKAKPAPKPATKK